MIEVDPPIVDTGIELPNGSHLYVKQMAEEPRIRHYFSDEVGGGIFVWNTMVDPYTLLAAMSYEENLRRQELRNSKC